MDMLKKFFPYSFGAKDVTNLAIKIVVYLVVGAVVGLLCGIIGICLLALLVYLSAETAASAANLPSRAAPSIFGLAFSALKLADKLEAAAKVRPLTSSMNWQ